jgi:DDE superfamily endonuclease
MKSLEACAGNLLATICAALFYQGESHDLQDTWLEDYDSSAYFAVSQKGWTNEELGLSWLLKLFEPIMRKKSGNATLPTHLLIVDGHSSHVNTRFLNSCDVHGIILAILPPHSTHRLQPLEVGIFSPLA